jgi:hypothetical protein
MAQPVPILLKRVKGRCESFSRVKEQSQKIKYPKKFQNRGAKRKHDLGLSINQ